MKQMRQVAEATVCGGGAAVGLVVAAIAVCMLSLWWDALGVACIPPAVPVPTAELLAQVPSGSLLLSRHVTEATRKRTLFNLVTAAGDWYHCGLLLRHQGELYVLDCMADGPTCNVKCAAHRPLGHGGPRLIPALQYMLLYSLNPGTCAVRRLEHPPNAEFERRAWEAGVRATRYDFLRGYEFPPKLLEASAERFFGVGIGRRSNSAHLASGVFCSEIAALILMELGVLDESIGASSLAPWSFCRPTFEDHLMPGHRYGPLERPDIFQA